ncbi:hypothetical protein FBEOM_13261 [Fusarium beomiforme]|uniref:Uncharacterized protein n=1 Tax=Fusarium beomiforme TaxID=44412 RepID=A0A9P5A7B7_9HYPO|nr:hypothetical protein FBEOM_13261 [Fusarium beomiforme]
MQFRVFLERVLLLRGAKTGSHAPAQYGYLRRLCLEEPIGHDRRGQQSSPGGSTARVTCFFTPSITTLLTG